MVFVFQLIIRLIDFRLVTRNTQEWQSWQISSARQITKVRDPHTNLFTFEMCYCRENLLSCHGKPFATLVDFLKETNSGLAHKKFPLKENFWNMFFCPNGKNSYKPTVRLKFVQISLLEKCLNWEKLQCNNFWHS